MRNTDEESGLPLTEVTTLKNGWNGRNIERVNTNNSSWRNSKECRKIKAGVITFLIIVVAYIVFFQIGNLIAEGKLANFRDQSVTQYMLLPVFGGIISVIAFSILATPIIISCSLYSTAKYLLK